MKKESIILFALLVFLLLLTVTACSSKEEIVISPPAIEVEPDYESEPAQESEPVNNTPVQSEPHESFPQEVPTQKVEISVDFADNVNLDSFASLNEFHDEGDQRIIFMTNVPVAGFSYVEIGYTEDSDFFVDDVLFSLFELLPDSPFVVTWMHQGYIPHRGITYAGENGETRYFTINQSGEDGSLILVEFMPK